MNFYPCGDDGPGPSPTRCDFPGCDHAALRKDQCGSKVTSDYCRKHLPSECNAVRAKRLVTNLQVEQDARTVTMKKNLHQHQVWCDKYVTQCAASKEVGEPDYPAEWQLVAEAKARFDATVAKMFATKAALEARMKALPKRQSEAVYKHTYSPFYNSWGKRYKKAEDRYKKECEKIRNATPAERREVGLSRHL